MLGADGTINCETTAGIGYAYNYTKASSQGRDTDIKGHTIFTYAKYQPEAAYVRGGLSYGYADYSEKSKVANVGISSKYTVHAVSSEVATGYEFQDGFIPEAGLRYTYLNPESYTDSLGQKVKPDNTNLLTATLALHFRPRCGDVWYNVRPNGYIGLTYDLYGPNTATNVAIADSHYQISSKRMARLGAEGGIGVEFLTQDWDFSIGYDLGLREDYQSHTGMLKARYNF
jgi:outer membrane autotransporter protein